MLLRKEAAGHAGGAGMAGGRHGRAVSQLPARGESDLGVAEERARLSATEPIHKPILLISASPSGASHAHAQLSEVLQTMSMRLVDGGTHVFSRAKLDAHGEVADVALLAAITAGVVQLVALGARVSQPDARRASDAGAVRSPRPRSQCRRHAGARCQSATRGP
jgi:hypothetical protein